VAVYAHSGATISGLSGESLDPNLNSGYPSLMDQANSIQNAADVDLILVSGGINDIGVLSIIDPEKTAQDISTLSREIEIPIRDLLEKLLKYGDAKIIVTGYYPIITEDTTDKSLDIVYDLFYKLGRTDTVLANNYKAVLVANSQAFAMFSSESLNNAISEINSEHVTLVPINFPSDKCYGTENSWLWKLVSLIPPTTDDDLFEYRSSLSDNIQDPVVAITNTVNAIGHPNRDGAKEYALAIESAIESKGLDWLLNNTTTSQIVTKSIHEPVRPANSTTKAPSVQWNKTINWTGSGKWAGYRSSSTLNSVQQTSDGGYIASGRVFPPNEGFMVKTDASGNEVWNKTFNGCPWCIQQTSDGGYILASISSPLLVKTDASGNEVWNKTFSASNRGEFYHEINAYSVQQTNDGGYIIAGDCCNHDYGILIKTESSGNEVWNKTFKESILRSVQQTKDGGYIVAGGSDGGEHGGVLLIKTDSSGREDWNKTFDGTSGYSVQQTNDGGYIVACGYKEPATLLIKTDSSGNEIWITNLGKAENERFFSTAYSVQQTNDGGYIIAGRTFLRPYSKYRAWLIKTNSYGSEIWNMTFTGDIDGDEFFAVRQTSDGGYIVAGNNATFYAEATHGCLTKIGAEGIVDVNREFSDKEETSTISNTKPDADELRSNLSQNESNTTTTNLPQKSPGFVGILAIAAIICTYILRRGV